MSTTEIPRRARVDKWVSAELAIQMAVDEVELMGADPKLTKAVVLLSEARDVIADFVDNGPTKPETSGDAT